MFAILVPLVIPLAIVGLIAVVAPVVIKLVVDGTKKVAPRVPRKTLAVATGVAVGAGLVAAGVDPVQAATIGGLSGPAAVGFHEVTRPIRERRRARRALKKGGPVFPPAAPHPNDQKGE